MPPVPVWAIGGSDKGTRWVLKRRWWGGRTEGERDEGAENKRGISETRQMEMVRWWHSEERDVEKED